MTLKKEYRFKAQGDAEQLTPTRAETFEDMKDAIDAQVDNLRLYREGLIPNSPMWERVDKMIDGLLAQKDALCVSPWLEFEQDSAAELAEFLGELEGKKLIDLGTRFIVSGGEVLEL